MTTPSIVIPSTSIVLLDSRKYNGPIIVQLASLKTVGTLTTVRDIGGVISNSRPIILSTVKGVRFHDGTSSFNLVIPYDSVSFQPKTQVTYELMNTVAYPPTLPITYTSSFHATYIIANSSIAATKNIANIDLVSSLNQQLSTIVFGSLVLSNSLTVSSPMTYIQNVNALRTDVGYLQANSLSTNHLSVYTIKADNINIFSSPITVAGSTTIGGPLVLCNDFTTQLGESVLEVGQLNANTISTSVLNGLIFIENNLTLPQICTISTIAQQFTTSIVTTNNLTVTNTLSTGFISPLRTSVRSGRISSISTNIQYARNLSTNSMIYDKYIISSFFINDSGNQKSFPLWSRNSSINFDKSVISFVGEELPTLPSTVIGLGTIDYLSSPNLGLLAFSTGQVYSINISTNVLYTPSLIEPIVSTKYISVNSLYVNTLRAPTALFNSLISYNANAIRLQARLVNNLSNISSGKTTVSSIFTADLSTKTINANRFIGSSITSLETAVNYINSQILNTPTIFNSSINASNFLANVYNLSSLSVNIANNNLIQTDNINTSTIYSFYNQTSTLLTNMLLFNDSNAHLFISSGLFYANDKVLISLNDVISQITSTSVGLGQTYLSSIKWLPSGLSTNQLMANNIYASSLRASNTQFNNLYSKNLNVANLQLDSLIQPSIRLSSLTANQGTFSSLRASLIATENLSLDKGSITGNNFVFTNLSTGRALFSTVSIKKLLVSSVTSRTGNISTIYTPQLSASNTTVRLLNLGNYTIESLDTRNTNATQTDSGLLTTSTIYAPILGINNLVLQNRVFNSRFLISTLTADISTTNAPIFRLQANTINTSTVRTSTFALTDSLGSEISIVPSTSKLYINGDLLQTVDIETKTLISTVNGIGSGFYISSYKNGFLVGLSTVAMYVNEVYSQNIIGTKQSISSLSVSSILSLSSGIYVMRAQNINLFSSLSIRQIRPSLLIASDVYSKNVSSGTLTASSLFANVYINRSTTSLIYLSSGNIQTPSLSSISLTASNLLVNSISASSMNANQVSTGSFQVSLINSVNTSLNKLSTSVTNTDSVLALTYSSINDNSISASFSSMNTRSSYFSSITTQNTKNDLLITIQASNSRTTVSTSVLNGTTINVSSGLLFINNLPVQSFNSIQNLITSTTVGLGSLYLSSYNINSLSSQFIIASSFSTNQASGYLLTNYAKISSTNTNLISTNLLYTSTLTANNLYANTTVQNLNIRTGQMNAISTTNINIYTVNASQTSASNAQFITLTVPYLQPQTLTSQIVSSLNILATNISTNFLSISSANISSFFTSSLQGLSYTLSSIYNGEIQTSSINVYLHSTSNLQGSLGSFSSLETSFLQINYLQTSSVVSQNFSAIITQAQIISYNQLNTNGQTSYIVSGSSTFTNSTFASQGNALILNSLTNAVQNIQTRTVTSQNISTSFLSTFLISTSLVQASTLYGSQLSTNTIATANAATSTFNLLGNVLSYDYPYLYLNNVNVTLITDANAIQVSTGQLNTKIMSTSLFQTTNLNTSNLTAYSTVLGSSTFLKTIQANHISIPNFGKLYPTLLTILSSYNSVRANNIIVNQISSSTLQYNNLTYSNLITSNLIVSTLTSPNLRVTEPLKISSLSSSNVITAAEGAYNLFYNSLPVGTSTFTSTATTVVTNGKIYVAGGVPIPSFWGAGALGSTTLATSVDGQTWLASAYNGLNQGVYRVIWTGSQFMAVGKGSATIAASSDGLTWSTILTSSICTSLNDIVQGRKGYVAVGENTIITSSEGLTWTSSFTSLSSIRTVTTNGSIYVAGGMGLATSIDGKLWTRYVGSTLTRQINDIRFNGSQFVAVGQEGIATSSDGLTWINQISTIQPKNVTWDGIEWLAAASSIYLSKDGLTWSQQNNPAILTSTFSYTGLSTIVTAPQGTNYVKIQVWGAGGAGGTSSFEPYYLSKTQLWLDASYQQSIILSTNTSTVQIWADRSSNVNLASTLGSVLPPAYYTSRVAFTSSTALTASLFQTQTPFTVSLIGKINSSTTRLFNNLQVSSSYLGWQTSYTRNQISTNSTIIFSLVNTLSTTIWRINGQEDSSNQGSFSSSNGLTLGQGQFDINEVLFFNSNMPTTTIQQIEGYYANKWSTLSLLPQSHPYRSMGNIHTGGGGAYVEGFFPLQQGLGSTFGIFTGQGGQYNVSTPSLGAVYNQSLFFSTSGGLSYDPSHASFQPTYFSSLGLWLDGKDPLGNGTRPQDGSPLNIWTDKSAQARSAVNVNGQDGYYSSGYVYLSSSAYQINYQNFNSTAYTIFTVQLLDSNQGTYQTLLSGGDEQPSLFSGVLSNDIITLAGDDTTENIPLVDATSWRITDMLVANNVLQPFVDGSAQNQKIGFTGSFSTLFLGALSPSLQNYIGMTQNCVVTDSEMVFSTFTVADSTSTTVTVYDINNNPLSTISYQMPFDGISLYDTIGNVTNLPITLPKSTSVSLYDLMNSTTITFVISTFNINQSNPTTIDVYNPSAQLSTLTLQNSYFDSISVYNPSLSAPYSSFSIYKPFTEVMNWQGRVGEVLCYDGALSVDQRQIVEGYLATKWNLQSNLPYNHPYRYKNVYGGAGLSGAGGGGAASGILLPNGQVIIAGGGGGGGQGTAWDGGGGGLDIGQRGSYADSCNVYGYSIYSGTSNSPAGGGGSNQGGQGAITSNATGGQGLQGQGGQGGIDSTHLALPGGGGGGGYWGGGGGAIEQSAGGGSSKWKDVAGFVPSFSYSMPAMGQTSAQTQGQGQGGYATRQGSNGLVIFTFLSNAVPTQYNAATALKHGSQNIGIDNIILQTGLPFVTTSSIIQSFNTNLIFNNTLYVDQSTNKVGINTAPLTDLSINGTIRKTAGSFVIRDPIRPEYRIRHCFTESPTAGDTLYRWLFSTVNKRYDYELPSWFDDLNTNPQVWVSPREFYQQGRGYVQGSTLTIETTADGLFEVLCVATRKDIDATQYFESPEYVLLV